MADNQDEYVDESGQAVAKDSGTWESNPKQYEQFMEGYFDYKERMINPASEKLTFSVNDKNIVGKMFKLVNRDLQLGNVDQKTYNLIYEHLHLGAELMRFNLRTAGLIFLQKAYVMAVMSNSKGGFLRKTENTSTNRRISTAEQPAGGSNSGWLRFIPGKKKQQ